MPTNLSYKILLKYCCENCHYNTSYSKDYNKHLLTAKHKILQNPTSKIDEKIYMCNCGKIYKHSSTLYTHTKKCKNKFNIEPKIENENHDKQTELIEYLLKENTEFKHLMLEQNKHMLELASKSGNNNNNSFNLNFFLNETCKNAMNIMDFVSQLQVGIKELEDTGRLGFAEGISKIFINGLKQIDISDRPIHCTDVKRETMYIKDKNAWMKESDVKPILTNAVKHVANKNMKQISEWAKEHPEFNNSRSKQNDAYLQIVSESMSGSSQEETNKNYTKIIKNIAKESLVDK